MRDVGGALQAHLDGGVTTLARCWRLALNDGRVRGFTEHDRDLAFGGVTYRAGSGFAASAAESRMGLSVGDQSVAGVLSDEGIEAGELEAGLYDGARVEIWMVNWAAVSQRVMLGAGEIGEVRRGAHGFEAEIRSVSARLNVPLGRTYQPVCDAVLGDARCGVDVNAPALRGEGVVVSSVDGRVLAVSGLEGFAAGWFEHGALAWTSGANEGLKAELRGSEPAGIVLWRAAARAVEAGDAFVVTAGCDKRIGTCAAKFGNVVNFRGCPHMPGNDWIAAYPVEGERNDGGSLVL
ncbi:MAG: DUF2163 domain-containing protein [Micropepsaceae bacterium]